MSHFAVDYKYPDLALLVPAVNAVLDGSKDVACRLHCCYVVQGIAMSFIPHPEHALAKEGSPYTLTAAECYAGLAQVAKDLETKSFGAAGPDMAGFSWSWAKVLEWIKFLLSLIPVSPTPPPVNVP